MKTEQTIGFVGLGKMGNPMARRLIDAGYTLKVYDIVPERAVELAAKGASVADSPRCVFDHSDVVITMLPPDDVALEAVVTGKGGLLEGTGSGRTLIDMGTVSPELSSRVAEAMKKREVHFLRATVSGSPRNAQAGTLTIFVSGPKAVYEECRPMLGILGQKLLYAGEAEEARYLKLLVNMIIGATVMSVGEVLAFGEKAGIDWEVMLDAIGGSVICSPLLSYKLLALKERDFRATGSVSHMAMDFDLALKAGRPHGVPLPLTSLVRQFMAMMEARGKAEMDLWGLVTLMEELAGVSPTLQNAARVL